MTIELRMWLIVDGIGHWSPLAGSTGPGRDATVWAHIDGPLPTGDSWRLHLPRQLELTCHDPALPRDLLRGDLFDVTITLTKAGADDGR